MTYEDILFLIGFFLVIVFFVGTGYFIRVACFCLSFLYRDASYISSFNLVRLPDA